MLKIDEKNALIDKVKFFEHNCCEKDNLIKLLKENELNIMNLIRLKSVLKS